MSEAVSHVYDGIASALSTTYSTGVSASTSGYDCSAYRFINVYVTVDTVTSSGVAKVYVDFSHDNATFFTQHDFRTGAQTELAYSTPTTTGSYMFSFPNAGKYMRVRMVYSSGTSVLISRVYVEGKS